MKKYIIASLLILPLLSFAQSIPEPGEWGGQGIGLALYKDQTVSMDLESEDNYVEAEGRWAVEKEGKYAGCIKLTMTVITWSCDGAKKGSQIDITPNPPSKFVLYLIKTKLGAQSVSSLSIQSESRQINLNGVTLRRGTAPARDNRPEGNG